MRFNRLPTLLQRKLDKNQMEGEAETCAFAINLCKEIRGSMPIDEATLEKEFLQKLVRHHHQAPTVYNSSFYIHFVVALRL